MESRLNLPRPEDMNAAQRAIYQEVLETRGNATGPFLAWLLSPSLAGPAQRLGAYCRYDSSLSLQESELLILHVAARYGCTAEQLIHEPIARHAGIDDEAVTAIREQRPPSLPTPRLRLLAEFAQTLLASNRVPDELYARAADFFGEKTLVEVVGIIGYYAFVAYTLNAFDMKP